MCDLGNDAECEGDLRCSYFRYTWPTGRKNCNYNGIVSSSKGYCMPVEDFVAKPTGTTPSDDWDPTIPNRGELIILPECPADGCPVCTAPMNGGAGCTADTDCAEGLTCYDKHTKSDAKKEQVSGCSSNKIWEYGYCYTKDPNYKPAEIPHLTEAPTSDDFILTNVVAAPEECAIYAADVDKGYAVPFSGLSGM